MSCVALGLADGTCGKCVGLVEVPSTAFSLNIYDANTPQKLAGPISES